MIIQIFIIPSHYKILHTRQEKNTRKLLFLKEVGILSGVNSKKIIDTYYKEKLDGSLHVSSHHVLLHAPIGVFSTHAMGDQRMYNERGLMHATVDAETASTISGEEFTNYTKKTKIIRSYETTHLLTTTEGTKEERRTWWVELAADRTIHVQKHLNPSKEDILSSSFITMPPGYDCYAILGEPINCTATYHLLQMTFTKTSSDRLFSLQYSTELFNNLIKRAGKNGFEASRSGGSQGECTFNNLMKKHLSLPGCFPRHANGMLIIILNSPQKCGYFGIYSSPYYEDGRLITWFYNTPRIGGHQN
jgi:hypothetical protein